MSRRGGKTQHAPPDFSDLGPTAPLITIVADEMLGSSALAVIRDSGARVFFQNEIGPGWSDEEVARFANMHHALVATLNVHDFKKLISRRAVDGEKLRHASMIALLCHPTKVADRLSDFWKLIVFEWSQAQQARDKRVIIEIGDGFARTYR